MIRLDLHEDDQHSFDKTIALVGGSFKPPHAGHWDMVQKYADKADEVIVLISDPKKSVRKTKNGTVITPEMSKKIFEKYIEVYGLKNVKVLVSLEASPITAAFKYIDDNLNDVNIIFGVSTKGDDYKRFLSAGKYYADNEHIHLLDPKENAVEPYSAKNGIAISATDIRDNIDDKDFIKTQLPDKLSDEDVDEVIQILNDDSLTEADDLSPEELRAKKRKEHEREKEREARQKEIDKEKNIIHFSSINPKTCRYYSWPTKGKELNSSQWLNYRYLSPVAKMEFVYNLHHYAISISPSLDPDHGGWRCIDRDEPPVYWLSPESCGFLLQSSVFKKFKNQVIKTMRKYLTMKPVEILNQMKYSDEDENETLAKISKTQRALRITLQKIIDDKVDNFNYN